MKRITLFALMLIFCLGGMAQQKKGTVKKRQPQGRLQSSTIRLVAS